jgi:hypothetical protein
MKKLLVLLVAAMTFYATACSTTNTVYSDEELHLPALQHYTLHVDPSVSDLGMIAVTEAAHQWSEFTNADIDIVPGAYVCIEIDCFTIYQVSFADFNTLVDGDYVGYTVPWFIFISDSIGSYDEMQDTIIHEDGHMLGLQHPCVSPCSLNAVMNPTYRAGADHVACLDVSQYNAVRPEIEAGTPAMVCTDAPGALDEAADGGPGGDL